MNDITLINHNGIWYADSREVAEMVGKRHDNLVRDIEGYIQVLETSKLRDGLTMRVCDFFIESTYESGIPARKYKNYLITKKAVTW